MEAMLWALLAFIGWGVGDIFAVVASRKMGGYIVTFWSYAIRIFLFLFYFPFVTSNLTHLTIENTVLTLVLSLVYLVSAVLFAEAFIGANASLVGTICAAFVVPTILFSVLFLHETLQLRQVIVIIAIVLGLIFTTLDFNMFKGKKFKLDRGIVFAFIVMILWGIYFSFIKIPVKELGWFLPNYAINLTSPLLIIVMYIKKIKFEIPKNKIAIIALLGLTALSSLANIAYNIGIEKGYVSTVVPIAASYPVIFVLLSFLFFKEKLKKSQVFGIIISLGGVVALSFLSV